MTSGIDWNPMLAALPFSPIRKMFNTASEMEDVVHLSIGQPDFPTPPHIIEAFVQALRDGKTRYELDAGLLRLREAVAGSYNERYGIDLNAENVLVTTGCCQAMFMALTAAVKPGMEVIVIEPVFVLVHVIKMAGAIPRAVVTTAKKGYELDPDQVLSQINENTCAIMLSSPGNPTGTVYPRSTVEAICGAAAERGLVVISDEVYERLILDGTEYPTVLTCSPTLDNVIVANSVSKTYAMAGCRLGWAISSTPNIVDLQRYHMFISTNENTPSQWATIAALEGDQACVTQMVEEYRKRCDRVVELVDESPHLTGYRPEGAFYIMPSLPSQVDGVDVAMRLLKEAGVCTIPGGAFGASCNNALRISFATSMEQIELAFERMIPWLERQSF